MVWIKKDEDGTYWLCIKGTEGQAMINLGKDFDEYVKRAIDEAVANNKK